ncbi:MAG TPA: hypothetical protein VKY41_05845 [Xanthomarina sp.]|nr:hypothetical protein [Xanthomarina sp.]
MFNHTHPYQLFIPLHATKLIVGTLPPPRFTKGNLKPGDVDFCYGSCDGQLWKILDELFHLNLKYETTEKAIKQRKDFLIDRGIGICDIVESAKRKKIDASDLGLQHVVLRDLVGYLKLFPNVNTLLFTGGNSKNGPEYFFRKHLKDYQLKLELVSNEIPRIHQFEILSNKNIPRIITTVSLTAPSGSANRAVGSMPLYKQLKQKNPELTTLDFRRMQYREFF